MVDNNNHTYLAAVEGGGTTFVVSVACVVDSSNDESSSNNNILNLGSSRLLLLHTCEIPRRDEDTGEIPSNYTPEQIIKEACSFFRQHLPPCGHYSALGIATFGPAGVDPKSKLQYGKILSGSPKKQWRGVDILSPIKEACGLVGKALEERVAFDTDVNAPAVAEFRHRCFLQQVGLQSSRSSAASASSPPPSKPLTSLSYITIGTGVGVGLILNSQPVHGLLHPEGGHICIQPLPDDKFTGYSWGTNSPYQGLGTVEGVASSVALTERWIQMEQEREMVKKLYGKGGGGGGSSSSSPSRRKRDEEQQLQSNAVPSNNNGDNAQTREILSTLPDGHPIWLHASNAIANLCVSLLLLTSCQKIVLGGGIMKREILYPMVRSRVWSLLNGYLDSVEELSEERRLDDVIVRSSWEEVGSGLVGAFALAMDVHEKGEGEEGGTGISALDISAGGKKKATTQTEQHLFTSGVMAGIGLSFGFAFLVSLLGRGLSRR
jgi:fructokinase